jgi:hypothetical protein
VAVDPQLVHDRPELFGAHVRRKCAQIQRFIAAIRFYAIEDEPGDSAQAMHAILELE